MRFTNEHNLPAPLVRAIEQHEHRSADYSASMLSNSARQVWLKRRHEDEIVEDVSDRIWALFGTAVHAIAAMGEGKADLVEQYFEEEVVPGIKVSGHADQYDAESKGLDDYKSTSAWSVVYGSRMKEWSEQLNTYAWFYRRAKFPVERLRIIAFLRDWSKKFVKPDGSYPTCQVVTLDIPLWTEEQQLAFILERVRMFESHSLTSDDELPFCTDEERWARDGKPPARCDDYCAAVRFCNQRQAELAAGTSAPAKKRAAKAGAA